jgi:hypothetical protein
MNGPYRDRSVAHGRQREAWGRLRAALGPLREPLFEECAAAPSFLRRIADMVTEWYAPFLVREIRQAEYYEDALPAASLLAFSDKEACLMRLSELLLSSRPVDVLVSVEALGDVVAFSPPGRQRNLAIFFLRSSGMEIAERELCEALDSSPYGCSYENPFPPLPYIMPLYYIPAK